MFVNSSYPGLTGDPCCILCVRVGVCVRACVHEKDTRMSEWWLIVTVVSSLTSQKETMSCCFFMGNGEQRWDENKEVWVQGCCLECHSGPRLTCIHCTYAFVIYAGPSWQAKNIYPVTEIHHSEVVWIISDLKGGKKDLGQYFSSLFHCPPFS